MNRKRFFASLLALAMTLTLLPVGAAAVEGIPGLPDVFQGDGVYVTVTPYALKNPGDWLILARSNWIRCGDFSEGKMLIVRGAKEVDEQGYYTGGRVQFAGYADTEGNVVLDFSDWDKPPVIPGADGSRRPLFKEGLAIYCNPEATDSYAEDVYGYINEKGEAVIPARFNEASPFSDGLARVEVIDRDANKSYSCYIDKTGEMVLGPYSSYAQLGPFSNGLAYFHGDLYNTDEYFTGYIDKQGNPAIDLVALFGDGVEGFIGTKINDYTTYNTFSEGYAIVADYGAGGEKKHPDYRIIDTTGKQTGLITASAPAYVEISGDQQFHEGLIGVRYIDTSNSDNNRTYFVDPTGKKVLDVEAFSSGYYFPNCFDHGVVMTTSALRNWDNLPVMMDRNGNPVMPKWNEFTDDYYQAYAHYTSEGMVLASDSDDKNHYLLEIHEGTYTGPGKVYDSIKGQFVEGGTTPTDPVTPSGNTPSSWALENVNTAVAAGIVPETLQSAYTQATTRAEFCALAVDLYETVKGTEITERATFSDTTDVNVEKMAGLKVVNGVGDGKFDPAARLTRQEAATMLARLANAIGKPLTAGTPGFADSASIADWAVDAVGQVQAAGIMNGIEGNRFAPSDPYTREQSIVTMLRLFNWVK